MCVCVGGGGALNVDLWTHVRTKKYNGQFFLEEIFWCPSILQILNSIFYTEVDFIMNNSDFVIST